jgi:hypothetical protein
MHIDRANKVSMTTKPADPAYPISAFGLVLMPTARTLATCSSFRAGEARDVSLFRFVGEIVDILSIFPQGHTLVMVSTILPIAHAMRIADEQRSYPVLNTEVNHLSCGFVSHVPNTLRGPTADFVLGTLQLLPTTGVFLATGLLSGKLSKSFGAVMLEGADTTPCHDQGIACTRGEGSKVDFSQIDSSLLLTRSLLGLWDFYTDVQFKTMVPDQRTRPAVFRKLDGQDDGFAPLAHRQDHPPLFLTHSLSRPFDRVEQLGTPGILYAHRWMCFTQLAGRVDVGKECTEDCLNRLAMQRKPALGGLVQLIMPRPRGMGYSCLLVAFHTEVPRLSSFNLSGFQAAKHGCRKVIQSVDTYGLHCCLSALLLLLDMRFQGSEHFSIERSIVLFGNLSHLFQQVRRKTNGESLDSFFHETIMTSNCNYCQGRVAFIPPPKRGWSSRSFL